MLGAQILPAGRLSSPCQQHRSPSLLVSRSRASIRVRAQKASGTPDDKSKSGASRPSKADFSAYWSMKVREYFSARRQYLEKGHKAGLDEPEALKELTARVAEEKKKLEEYQAIRSAVKAKQEQKAAQLAAAKATELLRPLSQKLFKGSMPAELAAKLVPEASPINPVAEFFKTLAGASRVLQEVLLLPYTFAMAIRNAWQTTFNSQRYENFLMSEGERIWYWRNRMENERWFWEVYFWDRLVFPSVAVFAYEYVVPNHLVWAVILPIAVLSWQNEAPLTFKNLELWLIAYFGFYKKCWPDVLAFVNKTLAA